MDITGLSLALGSSFTTGLNLYLTLFSLGMMQRLDVFTLPPNMQILANPWALVCIGVLLGPVNTKGPFVLYWGYENHRVPISSDRGLLSTSARQCELLQSRSA